MNNKDLAKLAENALKEKYPHAKCSLVYEKPHELLIAVRLSAQCTDARVNIVTPALFDKYKSVDDFANANVEDVENIIKSCGLYKTKARDIVNMCKQIRDEFGGVVPKEMDELVSLSGVGRKTANLIRGDIFGEPAVVVDTHCIRITARLGFHDEKNPVKIEKILAESLSAEGSSDFCHRLVLHGRAVCKARSPQCGICNMKDFCKYAKTEKNDKSS